MWKLDWKRDVPYKKGQEVEEGSFVYDVVNYNPHPNDWSHLRVVRREEDGEIHFHDIPRGRKPEKVEYENRQVIIFNKGFSGPDFKKLDAFLRKYEEQKAA